MDIGAVIEFLNKELGCSLDSSYYTKIAIWRSWWQGCYKPFHEYTERFEEKKLLRKLYSLRMAKKVCEDWASLLMNERTRITVSDAASNTFLQGKGETGGVFNQVDFWLQENALIEHAFSTGTAAAVLRFDNMLVSGRKVVPDRNATLRLEYLPAEGVIPISVCGGRVTEVALVSEVTYRGKTYDYLETHLLQKNGYVVHNRYFEEEHGALKPTALPPGVVEEYETESDIPLFALLSPNQVKNLSGGAGLGMSVFANAIDALEGVDLAFNNFCRDFKLGGKKVFYDQSLIHTGVDGQTITPDDIAMQLFYQTGDGMGLAAEKNPIVEYNPTLRVSENSEGVQAMLDYLSFKVGFGTKHYQFNGGSIVTATQYTGDKQELVQNASKHCIATERHIQAIVRAMLWAGKHVLKAQTNPDAEVTVDFDDSYIIDSGTRRAQMKDDVRDSVYPAYLYLMEWYGMSEAAARRAVEEATGTGGEQLAFAADTTGAGGEA